MHQYNAKSRSSCVSRLAYLSLALLVSGSVVILLVRLTLRAVEGVRASAPTTNINVAPTQAALPTRSAADPWPSDSSNMGPQVGVGVFTEPSNGLAAPDFSLPSLNGDLVNLSDMRGRFVILNFWATWCGPCRYEIPELKKLQAELGQKGLEVVGIAVDEGPSNEQDVRSFVAEKAIEYPIVLDPEGRILLLLESSTVPTTVLLDKNGQVAWSSVGVVQSTNPGLQEALAKVFAQ